MSAVELSEGELANVAAAASFTWGLSFSPSDTEIIISALHNLTDFSGEEIVAELLEFWNRPSTIDAEWANVFVYLVMEKLRTGLSTGEVASLGSRDMMLIGVALDDLSTRDKGDAETTYLELGDVKDPVLDQILAEDGELHRYCTLLCEAVAKFVDTAELLGVF